MASIIQDPGIGLVTIPGMEAQGPLKFYATEIEISPIVTAMTTPVSIGIGGQGFEGQIIESSRMEVEVSGIVTGDPFSEIEAKRSLLAQFSVEELLSEIRMRIMEGRNVKEPIGPRPSKAVRKAKRKRR